MCGATSLVTSMLSNDKLHFVPSIIMVSSIPALDDGATGAGSIGV